jgi:hypothetical protein
MSQVQMKKLANLVTELWTLLNTAINTGFGLSGKKQALVLQAVISLSITKNELLNGITMDKIQLF